ncbi:hypothetical protein EJ110_NYTH33216 [Nymphaea thermarum]|nr:hypothetical protein EJ110_NYTH33216 [Nymphaea thermarum]
MVSFLILLQLTLIICYVHDPKFNLIIFTFATKCKQSIWSEGTEPDNCDDAKFEKMLTKFINFDWHDPDTVYSQNKAENYQVFPANGISQLCALGAKGQSQGYSTRGAGALRGILNKSMEGCQGSSPKLPCFRQAVVENLPIVR